MKPEYKPLYIQVMENIRKKIDNNIYDVEKSLPSESEFAKEYDVSISTIRQAISILVSEGLIDKKQGKGTFVSNKKTKLTFFTWLTDGRESRNVLKELIKKIEKKYDRVEIEVIPTTYPEAKEELKRLIAKGCAPDIAHIASHWTGEFASTEALVDLEDFISENSLENRSEIKDLRGGRFNKKLYSLSWGLCPITMIVNMNILNKYGVDKISQTISIEEWTDLCRKIYFESKGSVYAYGVPYNDGEADFLRLYPFMLAFGGEFANSDGEIVLRSKENIKALNWIKDFASDGKVVFDSIVNLREKFVDGKIAFIHDGPWAKLWLNDMVGSDFSKNFKAILNPVCIDEKVIERGVSKSWIYNHALAVLSQSENAALASKVIDTLTMDEEISNFYYKSSGHLPVDITSLSTEVDDSDFHDVFLQQLDGAELINAENVYFPKAMDFCVDAIHNIFKKDVEVSKELSEKQHYLEILYGY